MAPAHRRPDSPDGGRAEDRPLHLHRAERALDPARGGTFQGDEIHSITRFGLHGLNSGDSNGTYFEQDANWNRVPRWGVGGIITNRPDLLLAIRRELES